VKHFADEAEGYNVTIEELQLVQETEKARDFYFKGVFGYKFVLERCLKDTTAPYNAIVEDDIIFAEGWMVRTLKA